MRSDQGRKRIPQVGGIDPEPGNPGPQCYYLAVLSSPRNEIDPGKRAIDEREKHRRRSHGTGKTVTDPLPEEQED